MHAPHKPPPPVYVYFVSTPYPSRLISLTRDGIARVCYRWLAATGYFSLPRARAQIGGVDGCFEEHLCRMISAAQQIDAARLGIWDLFEERESAREWSDDATVALFDALIFPSVYIETFAPEVLLRMNTAAPAPQWWIEKPDGGERPPVRTMGPVGYSLRRTLAAHLKVAASDVIPQITDWNRAPFPINSRDDPVGGYYSVRLHLVG
jgi:hypothetical protein